MELSKFLPIILWISSDFDFIRGALVVPVFGHSRHQFICGFGIPVTKNYEAVNAGMVFKAQYKLPESPHQLEFQLFPDIFNRPWIKDFPLNLTNWERFPYSGRKRREIVQDLLTGQSYERYESNVEQIGDSPLDETKNELILPDDDEEEEEFDDQFEEDLLPTNEIQKEEDEEQSNDIDLSVSRWLAYDALSALLEKKGFNGRTCVLRGICESADVQFSEHLMSELFHIFFTPSTTSEPVNKPSDYDFIKAEQLGRDKSGPGCEEIFHQCKRSIMEIFTEVYDSNLYQF